MAIPTEVRFGFECSSLATLERDTIVSNDDFRVEQISCTVSKTFTTFMELDPTVGLFLVSESGMVLSRGELATRWYTIPPSGIGMATPGRRALIRVAQGSHSGYLVTWDAEQSPAIMRLISFINNKSAGKYGSGLNCRTTFPLFNSGYNRFLKAINPAVASLATPLLYSVLAEAVAYLAGDNEESILAPISLDLQEPLRRLVDDVRAEPERPWPLKDAAEEVGYSPFHFSRIFKQQSGYGFHEFVDRTRTERAVTLLCSTNTSVDLVATEAGFGTTQGLRESVREYLGLVPTDLRSDPDDSLIS